jgi:transposase
LKRKGEVPPSVKLGQAINYTLSQWNKLVAYLGSYHLTPDNNASENAIRPFVLGRKNWLFNQSPHGADSSCGMFTLIETAKANGIEPYAYLKYVFEKAPYAVSTDDWEKLLPWNFFLPKITA